MTANNMMNEQIRNKYNTLTPAEAKKLNRYLGNRAVPIRTASVLNKPRAPPIVVTNLDDRPVEQQQQQQLSTQQQHNQISANSHHHDSLSNLSFRSSRDTPDCTAYENGRHFQTMSVDLGQHEHQQQQELHQQDRPASIAYDAMRARLRYLPKRSNTINTKFSDDSFSSAKSDLFNVSGRSSSVTPTKFTYFPVTTPDPPRSASKLSLSSSTYKVLQSPLANFKRLFRGIHRPFSQSNNNQDSQQQSNTQVASKTTTTKPQACAKSLNDFSLSDSISQISLNKSQSPTVLPPPPNELKSLGYIESEVNYSNYDEFTRARNERLLSRGSLRGSQSKENGSGFDVQQSFINKSDDSDDSSWQMTSLPVYYERNLTTVFEERQPEKTNFTTRNRNAQIALANMDESLKASDDERIYQSIKPPKRFDDFSALVDSSLDFQRRQPATPFRFSFAQPLNDTAEQASINANLGLPPRMPTGLQNTPIGAISINSEKQQQRHDNSSSGNSSNCSSQMNVINYCDRQNPPDSLATASIATTKNIDAGLSYKHADDPDAYGTGLDLNDPDSTIQSEASTIRGDGLVTFYANKCAELERTVSNLKNKLIVKEKELTELQLSQLNNDYTIERLKERLGKLERENTQLRTMVSREIVF